MILPNVEATKKIEHILGLGDKIREGIHHQGHRFQLQEVEHFPFWLCLVQQQTEKFFSVWYCPMLYCNPVHCVLLPPSCEHKTLQSWFEKTSASPELVYRNSGKAVKPTSGFLIWKRQCQCYLLHFVRERLWQDTYSRLQLCMVIQFLSCSL